MANDFWIPLAADLRKQCNTKLLEAEKDFWMTIAEMHQGMLEAMWEAAKKGEEITFRHKNDSLTVVSNVREATND